MGFSFIDGLPENVPFPYNRQQGEFLWNVLAEHGVRCTGLYAPGAYPCLACDGTQILGGLGNPDVSGGTGTWYVYTDDEWVIQDRDTRTGGKVIRLEKKRDPKTREETVQGVLFGPSNFVAKEGFEKQIQALREKGSANELKKTEREYRSWKRDDRKKKSTVEFTVVPDRTAGTAKVTVAGQTQTLAVGEWSDWFRVDFELSRFVAVPAIARMRLIQCDAEMIKFFVPAIDISPEDPPPFLRISSPGEYAGDLCKELGLYETVGWACITHGLKDQEISDEVFLEDIEFTMKQREKLYWDQLEAADFDVLTSVFYTPDRVEHMMYRLFDPEHPLFNAEEAERAVPFFGKEIKLKDAIPEIYRQVDRIVGETMARIEAGKLGPDATLLVVSDHGFAPFHAGINLNNLLMEKGFLHLARNGAPIELADVADLKETDLLALVDWERTRAYSLGLGYIYINLAGREPAGIVPAGEYDQVRDAIIRELEAFVDPNNGKRVVKKAFKREEIFSGPYWREGTAEFRFNNSAETETRRIDGFADIVVGFVRGYRVSWQTTLGGLEGSTVVTNDQKWSGDHVSVAPDEVMGVFFSNRRLAAGPERSVTVLDIAPTVCSIFGIPPSPQVDGTPLPLVAP